MLNNSNAVKRFSHEKSGSISYLIKDKSRDLQKLIKYFNGPTTSVYTV